MENIDPALKRELWHGDTHLESQHLGGRSKIISVS